MERRAATKMPRQPRSTLQFGDDNDGFVNSYKAEPLDVDSPMSLGSSTTGSFQQRTSWRTPRGPRQTPLSYSKRTAGTTFNFDNDSSPAPKFDSGSDKK